MPLDNAPGFTTKRESEEVELLAAGDGGESGASTHSSRQRCTLDSTNTDSGNTPTTTLRGGNVLATQDADGLEYIYSPTATDGTQNVVGVLPRHVDMLRNGVAADKLVTGGMLTGGLLRFDQLLNSDKHAEAVLLRRGFRDISRTPNGAGFLMHPVGYLRKATDYTVVAGDNGKLLIATAAVNFTLPTIAHGLSFLFHQSANANMVITGAADTILFDDTAGGLATTLTFSTLNKKLGATVLILAVPTATSTYRWLPMVLTTHTVTAA